MLLISNLGIIHIITSTEEVRFVWAIWRISQIYCEFDQFFWCLMYSAVPNVTFMLSIGPCRKSRVLIPLNKSILLLIWQWGCWKHCCTCENMKLSLLRQGCYLAMSLSYKCDLTPVTQAIVLPTGRGKIYLSVRCHKLHCYLRSASVFPDVLWKDRW